jgi:hypothetical protein
MIPEAQSTSRTAENMTQGPMMPSPRSRAVHSLLFLAGSVILTACEQPLTVRASPAPNVDAQITSAAASAGNVDPMDLARARAGLDVLVSTWGAPSATALREQAADARRDAEAFTKTLDRRPEHTLAEASRAAAARQTQLVHP